MGEDQVKDLSRNLGGIYDRLTKIEVILETRADFEQRIKDLKLSRAEARGKAMVLAVIASALTSISVSVVAAIIVWHLKG